MAELPVHPSASFRHFRDREDFAHLARIISLSKVVDGDERTDTPEQVETYYSHLERSDLDRDLLLVEVDRIPVGYSRVWWDREENGPLIYGHVCFLDPAHHGEGLGTAMFEWNEQRLREIAAASPAEGPAFFQVFANDVNTAAVDLIRRHGYEPVTYFAEMVRPTVGDLPDCPLPAGLELRPVTEDQLRTIWEADVEAFRDHWGFVEPSEERFQGDIVDFPYRDLSLWKVAWDDRGVAGQVRSFINEEENAEYGRKRGWTEFISTRRDWRGKGVAKALIVASIDELASRGMTEVALGVHTENPTGAFRLYESLGYEVVTRAAAYRKPLT